MKRYLPLWIYGWLGKIYEALLPEQKKKKDFYSHLNMEDIIDAGYAHIKRVCKDFKIKNLYV